jgi:hypothetical protein
MRYGSWKMITDRGICEDLGKSGHGIFEEIR